MTRSESGMNDITPVDLTVARVNELIATDRTTIDRTVIDPNLLLTRAPRRSRNEGLKS